ncbi:MAG: hypothetical protein BWY44_00213 [Candidatus Omnitrophica bacterium ADurb.Bin292]|nr:MAG: hypothetical protein BWY44_00213 [Candidatus Omnitrophica bacterium ADurb.Bin292]
MLKFGIETVGFGLVTVKVSFVGAPPNISVFVPNVLLIVGIETARILTL